MKNSTDKKSINIFYIIYHLMTKLNRKTTLNKLQALLFHVFLFNKLFRNVEILDVWIVNTSLEIILW